MFVRIHKHLAPGKIKFMVSGTPWACKKLENTTQDPRTKGKMTESQPTSR